MAEISKYYRTIYKKCSPLIESAHDNFGKTFNFYLKICQVCLIVRSSSSKFVINRRPKIAF